MKLVPWHQRSDPMTFRNEFDELVERFFDRGMERDAPALRRNGLPPVNIAEMEKSWNIFVEVPGMTEKEIQLQVLGRQLIISGERKWEEEKKGKEFLRVESRYGAFERAIELPENARLDPGSIVATYKKGMLEIIVPKIEPTPAAKIPVKAG